MLWELRKGAPKVIREGFPVEVMSKLRSKMSVGVHKVRRKVR